MCIPQVNRWSDRVPDNVMSCVSILLCTGDWHGQKVAWINVLCLVLDSRREGKKKRRKPDWIAGTMIVEGSCCKNDQDCSMSSFIWWLMRKNVWERGWILIIIIPNRSGSWLQFWERKWTRLIILRPNWGGSWMLIITSCTVVCFLGQTNVLLFVCFHLPHQAYDGLLSFSPVSLLVSGNYRQNISQLGFFFFPWKDLFYNYLFYFSNNN